MKWKTKRRKGDCFFHKWKIVRSNGNTYYLTCEKCSARKIVQAEKDLEPVDFGFLNRKLTK